MRKALIDPSGTVQNIIECADDSFTPEDGWSLRDADDAEIGGRWDGLRFVQPTLVVEPPIALPPSRDEFDALMDAVQTLTLVTLGG